MSSNMKTMPTTWAAIRMSSTDTQYKVFLLIWANDHDKDGDDDDGDDDDGDDDDGDDLLCHSVSPSARADCPLRWLCTEPEHRL